MIHQNLPNLTDSGDFFVETYAFLWYNERRNGDEPRRWQQYHSHATEQQTRGRFGRAEI
jgi:hypothetical protein